jgi:uncharacterized protein (TIGR03083 family)
VEAIRTDGAALGRAVRTDPTLPIPRYPAWSLGDLVVHTGSIHARTALVLRERRQERVSRQYPAASIGGTELVDWFEDGVRDVCDVLESTDPSVKVWSLSADRTAGFWLVRMALETAIHRWDADAAMGRPGQIDPGLAVCGIDEFAGLQAPTLQEVEVASPPRTVLLICRDHPASWVVDLSAGRFEMSRGRDGVEADAQVTGSASDLYLGLMGRADLLELDRRGDEDSVRSMVEAIGMLPDAKL